MRLCIVLATQLGRVCSGGVEKATHVLCCGLLKAGHDVVLVASGDYVGEAWGEVPTLGVGGSGKHLLLGGARDWNRAVMRALTKLSPDIVQGQGLGYAGAAVAGWRGTPRVVVAHGNMLEDLKYARSVVGRTARAPLTRAIATKAIRAADVVVNVTRDWRVNCPIAPARSRYIPNPIDDEFFFVRAEPEPETVAFFGGSRAIKGCDLLLAAWPRVLTGMPRARLDLYGVERNGGIAVPRSCRFLAPLGTSAEIAAAMAAASAVVIPSRFEVSPLVAAEAMAVGVPLVATDVGGVRAMTEGAAMLCGVDSDQMAEGLLSALREPAAWGERLREGRRRSAAFRAESVVASYEGLYGELRAGAEVAG